MPAIHNSIVNKILYVSMTILISLLLYINNLKNKLVL